MMALLLATLFIIVLIPNKTLRYNNDVDLQKSRALNIRAYHDYLLEYVDYAIKIPAKYCLTAIAQNMVEESTYGDANFIEENLQYCLQYFKLHNISNPGQDINLNQTTIKSRKSIMDQLVNLTRDDYGIETNYLFNNIIITQVEPDELEIGIEYEFILSGSDFVLKPERYETTVQINFKGVLDPMYTIKTGYEKYFEDILLFDEPYQDSTLFNLPFEEFMEQASYVQYSRGTSIDNRFYDELDSSDLSIISFINEGDVPYIENRSYVDIEYFRGTNFSCCELYCLDADNNNDCDVDQGFRIDMYTLFGISSSLSGFNLSTNNWMPVCSVCP